MSLNQAIIILTLTCVAVGIVFVIPWFVRNYYETIESYTTKEKKKNANVETTSEKHGQCEKIFTCIYNLKDKILNKLENKILNKVLIKVYNLKNKTSNKSEKKTSYILLIKQLEIYFSLITSYFCTVILYKLSNKLTSSANSDSGEKVYNSLDFTIYFWSILAFFAIFAIFISLINYALNNTKYTSLTAFILICLLSAILICLLAAPIYKISLLYITMLPVNYIFISNIKNLYPLLYTNGALDPAKLTLLWSIIVFILAVVFNIK